MDCPDTVTTIQGSLSEMTVGQAKGAQNPLNHPWLDLKGWLKGGQSSLLSPCLEGHRAVNSPMSLLMALWTLLRWPVGVRAGPGAVTLLTMLEAGTWWQMRKLVNGLGQHLVFLFCLRAFSSLPWYTLKASAKTSACGFMGPLSRCLSLTLMLKKL